MNRRFEDPGLWIQLGVNSQVVEAGIIISEGYEDNKVSTGPMGLDLGHWGLLVSSLFYCVTLDGLIKLVY